MRILVLADIHSNWPALAAIQEPFDVCLFVGDLVDYGTDPVPCIDWVRRNSSVAVRGNHDHAVAQHIPVKRTHGLHQLAAATRPLHWKVLSPLHMKYLTRLPVTRRVRIDQQRFYLVHATPRDPFDEYLREDKQAWESRLRGIDADFVLVGHTHFPFCMKLDRLTVLNPGSVGQPRDGDPRCAYALIENGRVEMRRVNYDIDATIRHMRDSGLDADTLSLAEAVLKTGGKLALSELEQWETREPRADAELAENSTPEITTTQPITALEISLAETPLANPTDETAEFLVPPLEEGLATTVLCLSTPNPEPNADAQPEPTEAEIPIDDTTVLQLPPPTAPSKRNGQSPRQQKHKPRASKKRSP